MEIQAAESSKESKTLLKREQKIYCCSYKIAPSAAISSVKSVMASPLDWKKQELKGIPLAD